MDLPDLEPSEYRRYGRHLTLDEVGEEGQRRLKASSALIVGAGGLGSPAALYLAAAGVGRLTLVDFDVVDLSNLQRQVLFGTSDLGRSKAEQAALRLADLNPAIEVRARDEPVDAANVMDLVRDHDVVLDGSDNFTTRYLVNDACGLAGRPYVYGSIFRFEGQASVFDARTGPCYRCLFPDPPPDGLVPNCAQAGVLGVLPGLVGSIQALEALKLLLGLDDTLLGRLLLIDARRTEFRTVRLHRDPACALCGPSPTIRTPEEIAAAACLDHAAVDARLGIDAPALLAALDGPAPPFLVDVREEWEFKGGALPGAVHVPLGDVEMRLDELPRDRDVVTYCRIGPRGARAAEILRSLGREGVRNLTDGLAAWNRAAPPDRVVG